MTKAAKSSQRAFLAAEDLSNRCAQNMQDNNNQTKTRCKQQQKKAERICPDFRTPF
jgi:hypothetical protein